MTKRTILTIFIFAFALVVVTTAQAQTIRQSQPIYQDVRAGACSQTDMAVGMITAATPLDALLFNRNFIGQPNPIFCTPLLNPDGSQMNLGEFNHASGRARVTCEAGERDEPGTRAAIRFVGLRPNGVYSIWIMNPNPNPGPPLGVGALGVGAIGENAFQADDDGVGKITRTTPAGPLSLFGMVGPCLLHAPFNLALVYHADNRSHGFEPGLPETGVLNAVFVF